jgi:hypothetical protein
MLSVARHATRLAQRTGTVPVPVLVVSAPSETLSPAVVQSQLLKTLQGRSMRLQPSAEFLALILVYVCHGLRLSCLMGNRASPLVRCDYPSHTSAVYSHSCISTVRSYTQYNLSSILQFFPHTCCSHTGTVMGPAAPQDCSHLPLLHLSLFI